MPANWTDPMYLSPITTLFHTTDFSRSNGVRLPIRFGSRWPPSATWRCFTSVSVVKSTASTAFSACASI